jgi:hypothetical protein
MRHRHLRYAAIAWLLVVVIVRARVVASIMTEGSIGSRQSLKGLMKSLYKELASFRSGQVEETAVADRSLVVTESNNEAEHNCLVLIRAIAAAQPPPSSRTAAMDKLLALAKRNASCFRSRSATREFRNGIDAIEKSLLSSSLDPPTPPSRPASLSTTAADGDDDDTGIDIAPPASRTGRRGGPESRAKNVGQTKKKSATTPTTAASTTAATWSSSSSSSSSLLPLTVSEYLDRLKRQSKELYKNPPALPPPTVEIYADEQVATEPQRDARSGRFRFTAAATSQQNNDFDDVATVIAQFRPNRSPEEILRGGAFGGTYFRTITSAVTNQQYIGSQVVRDTLPASWRTGLDEATYLTSSKYRSECNKFGAKCGGSLGMWESSGWIADADPYGWFQWYCRFYQGRRSSDDARQVRRWLALAGPKGRFKSQLCNKIMLVAASKGGSSKSGGSTTCPPAVMNDITISPVIRQTLWHWGLEITEDVLLEHQKKAAKRR